MDQGLAESITLRAKREQRLGAREKFWQVTLPAVFIKVSLTRCEDAFTRVVQRRGWITCTPLGDYGSSGVVVGLIQ